MPEIKEVVVQPRPPRNGDAGACEIGFYSVSDGLLTMHNEKGQPIGKPYRLAAGDNERVVASRLTLAAWRKAVRTSDFNRPLGYARSGIC
jgi:hypothetical protein